MDSHQPNDPHGDHGLRAIAQRAQRRIAGWLAALQADETGGAVVEYIVLVTLVACGTYTSMSFIGGHIGSLLSSVASSI